MSDLNSLIYKNLTTDHIDLSVKVNACFANDPKFYEQMQKNLKAQEEARLKRIAEQNKKYDTDAKAEDAAETPEQPEATKEAPDYDREAHKRFMRSFR